MNILTAIIFLPTLGALLCLVVPRDQVRKIAVGFTAVTFLVSLWLFTTFLGGGADPDAVFGTQYGTLHHVSRANWITGESFAIEYFVGVDGLSFPLVILTTLVSFLEL